MGLSLRSRQRLEEEKMASLHKTVSDHWPKPRQWGWTDWITIIPTAIVIGMIWGLALGALVMLVTSFPGSKAWGRDDGRYASVNPEIRDWVRGLKDAKGIGCCDTADGYPAEAVWDADKGRYRVMIENEWHDVPADALISGPNKLGYAVVWYFGPKGARVIRCFIPGTLS